MLAAMLLVEGGVFTSGAVGSLQMLPGEERRQSARVGDLMLDATEVTQATWAAVMGENPVATRRQRAATNPNVPGTPCSAAAVGDDLPVVCVDWHEVLAFANARSELEGLEPAYRRVDGIWIWDRASPGYRLPTHVEWERAARGTERKQLGLWDTVAEACEDHAVLGGVCAEGLEPVSALSEGPYGHRGLYGNAREWVWFDRQAASATELLEHRAPGFAYLVRGASWQSRPDEARVSARMWTWDEARLVDVGVRLARNPQ